MSNARDAGGFSALRPLGNVRQGGIVPSRSVVAPETALGSVPTGALSSAQAISILARLRDTGNSLQSRRSALLFSSFPRLVQLAIAFGMDRLLASLEFVERR